MVKSYERKVGKGAVVAGNAIGVLALAALFEGPGLARRFTTPPNAATPIERVVGHSDHSDPVRQLARFAKDQKFQLHSLPDAIAVKKGDHPVEVSRP